MVAIQSVAHCTALAALFFCLQRAEAIIFGPSVELLTRTASGMRLNEAPAILNLANHHDGVVVLPLIDGESTAEADDIAHLFQHPHRHEFFVRAEEGRRVIAVIQALNLPTDDNYECEAYIDFLDTNTGASSGQICGMALSSDADSIPDGLLGPRYFVSEGTQLRVGVHIPANVSDAENDAVKRNRGPLTLEISFTAFSSSVGTVGNCTISPNDPWRGYVPVSCSSESSTTVQCISSHLFCDGIFNCAGGSVKNFGFDEHNCTHSIQPKDKQDPEEVRILEEIKYRKMLRELDQRKDEQVNYIMIALGSALIVAIIVGCVCYWFLPSKRKLNTEVNNQNAEQNSVPGYLSHIDNLGGDTKTDRKPSNKSIARLEMPATMKVNPDGSHEIEAYHGNRRFTISVPSNRFI